MATVSFGKNFNARMLARLRLGLRRLGWPALLGCALALIALIVQMAVIGEVERELTQLHKTRADLRARMVDRTQETQTLQLGELQDRAHIDALVEEMHAIARKHAVTLEQGEYRLTAEQGTRLARYRMVIPARGAYLPLRAWLDDMARSEPGLLIDDLAIKRENIGQETLEARVSFSVLVRAS